MIFLYTGLRQLHKAYKIITADKAFDFGFYEEKIMKNGRKCKVKSKATVKQKIIITFSRKMMEYQRFIRNRQIERARFFQYEMPEYKTLAYTTYF